MSELPLDPYVDEDFDFAPAVPVWTLNDARDLLRVLQPELHARKWHVALGGGVLNAGQSYKDLDLYFLPFGERVVESILPLLRDLWGTELAISDYPPDENFSAKVKFFVNEKRIDAFIGRYTGDDAELYEIDRVLRKLRA